MPELLTSAGLSVGAAPVMAGIAPPGYRDNPSAPIVRSAPCPLIVTPRGMHETAEAAGLASR